MTIKASEIADYLSLELFGEDIDIESISTLDTLKENSICFAKHINENLIEFSHNHRIMVIADQQYKGKLHCSYAVSKNPRLDFIRMIQKFFQPSQEYGIDKTAKVLSHIEDVKVGAFTFIDENVKIGKGTVIGHHVTITGNAIIGSNCIINSGTVIGESGFGYERDENGIPQQFYHIGSVKIGDNVHIGANNTIARASIGATVIEDHVKTDNLVHIAHNCFIGENTLITAKAELSGGVVLGKNVWIGPNTCIREKIHVGDSALVGIGAVVVKDVEADCVYAGNPARLFRRK